VEATKQASEKKKRGKNLSPRIKNACHNVSSALLQSVEVSCKGTFWKNEKKESDNMVMESKARRREALPYRTYIMYMYM
jgi:hypothetical protein